jgi:hypothetical protein
MDKMQLMEARMHAVEERIRQLEAHIHYPNIKLTEREQSIAMKEASVRQQALYAPLRQDTAPMRSDVETIMTLKAFARNILDFEMYGHAVTKEVRNEARRALGIKEVEV